MDSQRVHPEFCGLAHARGGAWRTLWAPEDVRHWTVAIYRSLGGVCALAWRWLADRRSRHPGMWRRAGHAAGIDVAERTFPPEQRGRALGAFSGAAGLAVLAGPVVGGAIVQGISWQWIFWLNVPVGLLVIPLVLSRMEESYGPRTTLDVGGLLLVSGAALGLVWGLVRGNSAGWGSFEIVASLTAGLLLAVAFVMWELRVRVPMLPMRFFRSRSFAAGNAAGFFFFASLNGSVFFLAQFLQTGLGYSPLEAGVRMLPETVVLFAITPISGILINRLGERTIMVGAMLLQAVAMIWIGLIARPGIAYSALIAPLFIAGFGAAAIPTSQSVVIGSVAPTAIGKASGTFNMLRQLGAAFGVAILAAVCSRELGVFTLPRRSARDFRQRWPPLPPSLFWERLPGCCCPENMPRLKSASRRAAQPSPQPVPHACGGERAFGQRLGKARFRKSCETEN